jgi:hypothetical protein
MLVEKTTITERCGLSVADLICRHAPSRKVSEGAEGGRGLAHLS